MINKTIVGIVISGCLLACSPTARIAQSNVDIRSTASSSMHRFNEIDKETATASPNLKFISTEAKVGAREQEYIIRLTDGISIELTRVEDSVPWWANLIQWVMIALSILGTGFLLWYLGLGKLTQKLFNNLGLMIPERKKSAAKLLDESLEDPDKVREAIAAMRASDPTFDAAYRQVHKKG